MKREVLTYNQIEGFHNYPNAPQFCEYLSSRHRHQFVIECAFAVSHNNRQIEINEQQLRIERLLYHTYGHPCEFGAMSCEDIAEFLLKHFIDANSVTVKEDGYGGASITR